MRSEASEQSSRESRVIDCPVSRFRKHLPEPLPSRDPQVQMIADRGTKEEGDMH
jgi:hypothetical protein